MSSAASEKGAREAKVMRLVEFALEHKDDPDFNRLVFPADVLAALAERGVKVAPKEYTASAAVDRCFNMSHTETYTANVVEVIDQTAIVCSFPPIPPLASPTETSETKTPELEDSPSSLVACAASSSVSDAPGPSSADSPAPLPDRTE